MTDAELKNTALREADACLDSQVEFLKKLARIDCGTQNLEGNRQVVELVENELKKIEGIEIFRFEIPDYGIDICAKLPCENAKEKIILNAHTDTVFAPDTAAGFPPHIDGDYLYGLGTGDCKGGIAVCINAVKIAQQNGLLPRDKQFVFMFNCDEEKGTEAGYAFFNSELPADKAFVFEGAGDNMGVITGRKDRATFRIDVEGVRSHSGNAYCAGRSAVVEIAHKIQRLYENNDAENEIFFNFGPIESKDPLNVLSGHASVKADVRLSSAKAMEKAEEIIKRVCEEPPYLDGTKTTYTCIKKASRIFEKTEKTKELTDLAKQSGEILGFPEINEFVSGGFGDVNYFASKGVVAIDGLGPRAFEIHSTNEHININSLRERTALFVCMLAKM